MTVSMQHIGRGSLVPQNSSSCRRRGSAQATSLSSMVRGAQRTALSAAGQIELHAKEPRSGWV